MMLAAGLLRPKCTILGMDFAGLVEAVGAGVTAFKPGDRVFGLSPDVYGAHAEYLCVPEQGATALMPAGAAFGQVVVCEGAWYADTNLQALGLKAGHNILIYGASGAIGTAAVQLAKSYGAKVTAVVATQHMELVSKLGADRVIDYTAQDFTQIGERRKRAPAAHFAANARRLKPNPRERVLSDSKAGGSYSHRLGATWVTLKRLPYADKMAELIERVS
mgnify:FL=1